MVTVTGSDDRRGVTQSLAVLVGVGNAANSSAGRSKVAVTVRVREGEHSH